MHSRILNYLDEVVRTGSIRQAAERLHVSASAISRQIIALEDDLGTPIFNRTARTLVLTAAGEVLIRHIRDTLKDMARTQALIDSLKGLRRGEFTLCFMSGLAASLIPGAVSLFLKKNPRVTIKLQLMTTGEEILEAVASGAADLGVGFDFATQPGLIHLSHSIARLGAVMAPDHPLAERSTLRIAECMDYPLILADGTTAIRPYLDRVLSKAPPSLTTCVETNAIETMRSLAMSGHFITFLTLFDIDSERQQKRLVYIPVQEFTQKPQSLMLVGKEKGMSAMASVFAESLKVALLRTTETG